MKFGKDLDVSYAITYKDMMFETEVGGGEPYFDHSFGNYLPTDPEEIDVDASLPVDIIMLIEDRSAGKIDCAEIDLSESEDYMMAVQKSYLDDLTKADVGYEDCAFVEVEDDFLVGYLEDIEPELKHYPITTARVIKLFLAVKAEDPEWFLEDDSFTGELTFDNLMTWLKGEK